MRVKAAFAWLGGVLFVVSLTSFVVVYGIVLEQPWPETGATAETALFDIALFTVFALHHSVMARTGAKNWIKRAVPAALERSVYVWTASLLFLGVCLLWRPLPGVWWDVGGWARWGLHVIQFAGLSLTFRAAGLIDVFELAGIRQPSGRTRPVEFKAEGPFALVRHPIYLGWFLIVFAAPKMTMSRLVFAAISSLYLIVAIPLEERSLVEGFGDRYRAYQERVRYRLLPGVW